MNHNLQFFCKQFYDTNNQRQKTLRGLGNSYRYLWKRSRNLANLELSIKYQIEVVGKEDNSKIFDLTFLAGILLQKYVRHTKNNKIKNDLKNINSKIAKELKKKNQLNTNSEIQACYTVAEYNKTMNDETREIKYLRKILDKVGEAKIEDNRKSLKTIEQKTKEWF